MSDEIVVRLRHIFMEPTDDDLQDVTEQAADEIERLRADLAAERALADQLADALRWQADPHQTGTLGITHKALDAYEEARRER